MPPTLTPYCCLCLRYLLTRDVYDGTCEPCRFVSYDPERLDAQGRVMKVTRNF